MKILFTNFRFNVLSGSETWIYTMIIECVRRNIETDLYILQDVSPKSPFLKNDIIKKIKIYMGNNIPKENYDIIFANHTSTIDSLIKQHPRSKIIQTCHGIFPKLEQPYSGIKRHISITKEVENHLKNKNIDSELIYNCVDLNRFRPNKPISDKLINVLSLVQDNTALSIIRQACKILNLNLMQLSKAHKSILNIEDAINNADLVITIGRGVYESMSCGRNVISFDCRGYHTKIPQGHGLLTSTEYIDEAILDNFSGRKNQKNMNLITLVNEMKKYSPEYGNVCREYALKHFCVKDVVNKYISLI